MTACGDGSGDTTANFDITSASCSVNGTGIPSVSADVEYELSLAVGQAFLLEITLSDELIVSGSVEGMLQCHDLSFTGYTNNGGNGTVAFGCSRDNSEQPDQVTVPFGWEAFIETSTVSAAQLTFSSSILAPGSETVVVSDELVVDCALP